MVHKWYIHLEFHFCTFYDFNNLTFTTCNCCISMLPNHSRCLTCLASVVALVTASACAAAMEGFSATCSSANAPTWKCHWPHSATNQRVAELIFWGSKNKTNKNAATLKRTLLHQNWQWPRVSKAINVTHVLERTQALCNKDAFMVFLRAHRVFDACILLHTLKLLVEAACWFWRCPTQESNQSKRKFLEENISWQSLYTVYMIQSGFRTWMAPAFSHGYAGLLVFLLHTLPLHNTRSNQKTAEMDSLLGT